MQVAAKEKAPVWGQMPCGVNTIIGHEYCWYGMGAVCVVGKI